MVRQHDNNDTTISNGTHRSARALARLFGAFLVSLAVHAVLAPARFKRRAFPRTRLGAAYAGML